MSKLRRLVSSSLGALAVFGCVQNARAEEPAENAPRPLSAHEERVRVLRERAEEVDAEVQLERSMQRLNAVRRPEAPHSHEEKPPEVFRPGRVLLPELAGGGFSSLPLYGVGAAGSVFYSAGPITFSYGSNNANESSLFAVAPSADVVVSEHLTLGGTASFARQTLRSSYTDGNGTLQSSRTQASSIDLKPRIGVPQHLGGGVWVWPRLAARVGTSWTDGDAGSGHATSLGLELDVPFVFPLSRWVFLQVAPTASYTHVNSPAGAGGDFDAFSFGSYARLGLAL